MDSDERIYLRSVAEYIHGSSSLLRIFVACRMSCFSVEDALLFVTYVVEGRVGVDESF